MSKVRVKNNLKEKFLSGILIFVGGFVGMMVLGAVVVTILISLGIIPAI